MLAIKFLFNQLIECLPANFLRFDLNKFLGDFYGFKW
jgi:hypothetical protein